ncbi:hypothetical protein ACXYX3_16710 [Mycobacterium sp. C3-094]
MVLSATPARLAIRRTHVLAVEIPGHWSTRVAVQRRVRGRGWTTATSAADADVLAVCGTPGPGFATVIDRVWDQLPGPRVRIDIADAGSVDDALDRAAAGLLDDAAQVADARNRPSRPDTGDGDMAPSGIPLAEGADDRDGLEMDVLHLPLGPVLPHWPAGVVLRCVLSGDVVTDVDVDVLDGENHCRADTLGAARQCDHLLDLFALAGWRRGAVTARRCRDLLLDDPHDRRAAGLLDRLQRDVRRSRLLRWSLRGLAPLSADHVAGARLPAFLAGDAWDRLLTRLRVTAEMTTNASDADPLVVDPTVAADALPGIVTGLDVAAVRLVIAGLGVDADSPDRAETT